MGGQAESVPNSTEAVGEAARAAAAEHVEADTGECGGMCYTFNAAQDMYLQYEMFVSLC